MDYGAFCGNCWWGAKEVSWVLRREGGGGLRVMGLRRMREQKMEGERRGKERWNNGTFIISFIDSMELHCIPIFCCSKSSVLG